VRVEGSSRSSARTIFFEDIEMQTVIRNAPPALKAFLDARAAGAPRETLVKLGNAAMAEQEEDRAKKRRVRLIVNNNPDLAG
jgi:hypothetical protein